MKLLIGGLELAQFTAADTQALYDVRNHQSVRSFMANAEPLAWDRHVAWVRATEQAMRPWTTRGMALNFVSEVDDDRVRSAFGAEKYRRLVELKDRYDPDNVFSLNQNVRPSGSP